MRVKTTISPSLDNAKWCTLVLGHIFAPMENTIKIFAVGFASPT